MAARKKTSKVKRARKGRKLGPIETRETKEHLERRLAKASKGTRKVPDEVPLNQLLTAEEAFQWRGATEGNWRSAQHIQALARDLRNQGEPFKPILIYPIGNEYYVVDGHHRLYAYYAAGWTKKVPVKLFRGTLKEAYRAALDGNANDKLPMTQAEKFEAAWRLVKEDELSIKETERAARVSHGTVSNMRSVRDKLLRANHKREVASLSWPQARRKAQGIDDNWEVDEWFEKKAAKVSAALKKAGIAPVVCKNPDVFAAALEWLWPGLLQAMALRQFSPEDLREMAAGMEEYEKVETVHDRPFDPHGENTDYKF